MATINDLHVIIKKGFASTEDMEEMINKFLLSKHAIFALIPAKTIVSELQIISAIEKAEQAFKQNKGIAKNLSLEFLLFLYCTTQINRAIEIACKRTKKHVLVIASKSKQLAKKMLECAKKHGFEEREFKLKPNVAKLSKLYKIACLSAYKHMPKQNALELAILERQALCRILE